MSNVEWFRELRKPEQPDYVETGDGTIHPIQHFENVPFNEEGNLTYMKNVLHVLAITKNLVSVGQIMEQGMQVWFNDSGYFLEKEGRIIARTQREGRMFIHNSHEMKSTMFAKGHKVDADIDGTKKSTTLISKSSKERCRKELSSNSRPLLRTRLQVYAKLANSANNAVNHSQRRAMWAKESWMYYIKMYGDQPKRQHLAVADIM